MRLLSFYFWKELSFFHISKLIKSSLFDNFIPIPSTMAMKKKTPSSKVENVEETTEMCVLDLPELILESILERLPANGLCSMASVCNSLRDKCSSDHLWERHMKQKWGRIIGPAAHRKWQWHTASRKDCGFLDRSQRRGLIKSLSQLWPLSLIRSNFDNISKRNSSLPVDSIMSWYIALETGKFWFPAQVYNRENGHVGFMLSCYDAELCYDPHTDTFQARYPPHGRRPVALENCVTWDRLRAPPIDTSPHDLHNSDCLNELCPGDHIEIQWRRNKEFPYGWWYGVVGHLESCDGSDNYCSCHESGAQWCWSSTNTLLVHGGDELSSTGKTIVKKEMRQMGFMAELENFTTKMRFPRGGNFGHQKFWNRPQIEIRLNTTTDCSMDIEE
ncbi:unnamed protein product [Camellia sinensis]